MACLALVPFSRSASSPSDDVFVSNPIQTYLSKNEIVSLAGITVRSFWRLVKQPGVFSVEGSRLRNGRDERMYIVSTLPPALRGRVEAALAKREAAQKSLRPAPKPTNEVAPLFAAAEATSDGAPRLLSPEEAARASAMRALILPLHEYAADRDRYKSLRLRDGRAVTTSNLLAEYIAETQTLDGKRVSTSTLWNWLRRWREGGDTALARKPRADKGKSNFFRQFPSAADLAAAEYLKPYSTAERAYNAIVRDRKLLGIAEEEMPSYSTVVRYLGSLPKSTAILARDGRRKWNETVAPHLTRGYADVPAGSIYTADHMIHDVEVRNDCFLGVPTDAAMRLRLTAIMCLRSRKIVGCAWTAEGDSRSIVLALRRAVERFGPPERFYCDNGQDFKKMAKGARRTRPTDESIREGAEWLANCGALQRLGVEVQFCLPYGPQAKNIERFFGTLHQAFDGLFPTYLTGNSYNRPDAANLLGGEHRRLVKKGRGDESELVLASHFIKLAETWIEQDYNARHKHTGKGMDGKTPNEIFDAGYPVAQRRKADPGVLAMLLWERTTAMVRRTAVTVNKRRYVPLDSADTANLYNANLTTVVVAYDPNDPDRAAAYSEGGHLIAHLQAERLTAHPLLADDATRRQIAEHKQTHGRLEKTSAIVVQTMNERVALAGHKSALAHLAERTSSAVPLHELTSQRAATQQDAAPGNHNQMQSADIGERLRKRLARTGTATA